jgi:plastocyanin
MKVHRVFAAIAAALALSVGTTAAQRAYADSAAPAKVEIKDFMFEPTSIKVKAGDTVTWLNLDEEPHTVVSDSGLFRSSAMDTNDSFKFKFDKPGTYRFVCSIHPKMVGTIVVQ